MELNIIIRDTVIQYETYTNTLGIYDNDNVNKALLYYKKMYPKDDIYIVKYNLNEIED